jgi:hypothetical protein
MAPPALLALALLAAVPVGAARVDVTPDGPVLLNGYAARNGPSTGVQQRIWAKALAIGGDAAPGPAVLVTLDNLGITDALAAEVADRLRSEVGLPRERLAIAASHTHSAPMITGLAPNLFGKPIAPADQEAIDAYTRTLAEGLVAVVKSALNDRQPAALGWAQGRVGFALNRRTKGGPVDHALPMLGARSPDGRVRAVLVNYACHCTTLDPADNLISGDWAGDAQEAIEADHPGAVALVAVGCGGDSNPEGRVSRDAARRHGRAIADEVERLLAGSLTPLEAAPAAALRRVTVPFDTLPTRAELETVAAKGGYPGYNARTQLARLDRGEPLQSALDYPVQVWAFGDRLAMVFLAGEVVVDYSLRLKRELDAGRTWISAYSNDVPCYIPSERILKEGGYEGGGAMVYYGRPTRLAPGVEGRIVGTVRELVPPAFRRSTAR